MSINKAEQFVRELEAVQAKLHLEIFRKVIESEENIQSDKIKNCETKI